MNIANSIRQAVMDDDTETLMDDELINKVLSAFMCKGEWLASYEHAMTFALLVAAALDGGAALAGDGSGQNQGSSMDADRGGERSDGGAADEAHNGGER